MGIPIIQSSTWAMWFCDVTITPLARAWPAELALRLRSSLVPRPHPLRGKRGLVNLDHLLGLVGSVRVRRNCCTETNLGSDWSVMLLGRGPTIQIYIAGN